MTAPSTFLRTASRVESSQTWISSRCAGQLILQQRWMIRSQCASSLYIGSWIITLGKSPW